MVTDNVNHPAHYNSHPSGVECITITEHMNFNVGNAIKYLWRAGIKVCHPRDISEEADRTRKSHLEDLKKAAWYINREIERLQKTNIGINISDSRDNALRMHGYVRKGGFTEYTNKVEK